MEARTLEQQSGAGVSRARRERERGPTPDALGSGSPRKSLTIGAVCKQLQGEFTDISISKIRYLEDQKLLSPQRTEGGYRLYSPADVSRLRTILRLQRDEFMPLRVIRQELAAGRTEDAPAPSAGSDARGRVAVSRQGEAIYSAHDLLEYTGVDDRLLRELEDFGVISGEKRDGTRVYDELDREIVRAVGELTRYGVAARNLRVFRTSADREAALLEQILGASLRSRNSDRRREAVDALESLAAVVSHLKHLLLIRDLRGLL